MIEVERVDGIPKGTAFSSLEQALHEKPFILFVQTLDLSSLSLRLQ